MQRPTGRGRHLLLLRGTRRAAPDGELHLRTVGRGIKLLWLQTRRWLYPTDLCYFNRVIIIGIINLSSSTAAVISDAQLLHVRRAPRMENRCGRTV